jgi:hypothetical protein
MSRGAPRGDWLRRELTCCRLLSDAARRAWEPPHIGACELIGVVDGRMFEAAAAVRARRFAARRRP